MLTHTHGAESWFLPYVSVNVLEAATSLNVWSDRRPTTFNSFLSQTNGPGANVSILELCISGLISVMAQRILLIPNHIITLVHSAPVASQKTMRVLQR